MTDHRMVGSVRTCPFLGKFPLAQSIGPLPCFAQWLDGHDLGGGSLSLCLSAEALVHIAEATSIVAEATTLISIRRQTRATLFGALRSRDHSEGLGARGESHRERRHTHTGTTRKHGNTGETTSGRGGVGKQ